MRIEDHPILEPITSRRKVTIYVDDQPIEAFEGEPILAALIANGKYVTRITVKEKKPRGLFCGVGRCTDCVMMVDGNPNVRTCVAKVVEGMRIQTQKGKGSWGNV